jgi:hypothetical protein
MIKIVIPACAAIVGLSILVLFGRNLAQTGGSPVRPSLLPLNPAPVATTTTSRSAPDLATAQTSGPNGPGGDAGSSALVLSPVPAIQGGTVRVSGRGFAAGEMVLLQVTTAGDRAAALDLGEVQANQRGEVVVANQPLPKQVTSGSHELEAVGEASGTSRKATLYVRAKDTWINLGKKELSPGEKLAFIAGGFAPNERVQVSLEPRSDSPSSSAAPTPTPSAGATPQPSATPTATPRPVPSATPRGLVRLATLATDRVGNGVWTELATDHVKRGTYTLVLRGQTSRREVRKDVTLKPYHPSVELSPWYGLPGMAIHLNVRGLAPGESVHVFVGFDSREAGRGVADQYGNLWGGGPVKAPYDAGPGPLAVTVIGDESRAPTTVEYKVGQAKPWLELTNWWGAPGSPVSFTGGGWDGGEDVTVHLGTAYGPVVATGQADEYGWLRGSSVAYVPRSAYANVTFIAVGQQSHTSASATFKLVLPYWITQPQSPSQSPSQSSSQSP